MKKFPYWKYKKYWIATFSIIAVFLLTFLFLISTNPSDNDATSPSSAQDADTLRAYELLGTAKSIKHNLLASVDDIQANNFTGARSKLASVQKDIASTRAFIDNNPILLSLVPQAESITKLMNAADMAIADILLPGIDLLESQPISGLRVGDGFDARLLCAYIDFTESIMPKAEYLIEKANSFDLSIIDSEGKLTEPLALANTLLDIYHETPEIFSMLRAMLGAQEDRLYLIAVQNPSEIRASGGFPGAMGTLRIQDGILTIGEFESVVNYLSQRTPSNIQITKEEHVLFSYLSSIRNPRDADLCPDFERVGHIWASSYEEWHQTPVSGIVSVTPHIVQRLLAVLEKEIELSDGLVLTGENALKVLIHDIYFKYYDRENPHPDRSRISDQLFAESAKKVLAEVSGNISLSQLLKYLPVVQESIEDRTLMFWMKDEAEQAFIANIGWSGSLNKDPQNPEVGIYVNVVSASKMGWFLLMDTEIGEPVANEDGSYSYPITVTFSNNITPEEINAADKYISGGLGGSMWAAAYFFAPAGGSVDHFEASTGRKISLKTYNGMTLGFTEHFSIRPDEVITITYTATTAPGVDTPLGISQTPTAQKS